MITENGSACAIMPCKITVPRNEKSTYFGYSFQFACLGNLHACNGRFFKGKEISIQEILYYDIVLITRNT